MTEHVDDAIYQEVVVRDCYRFAAALQQRPTVGEFVVVDLGAHVGHFTRMAADGGALVLAVEMEPLHVGPLLEQAKGRRIIFEHAAVVGDRRPIGYRRTPGNSGGAHFVYEHDGSAIEPLAVTRTLAELVDRLGLSRIDFLKLDIEGAEWDVLARAERDGVLARVQRIGMEWHHPVDPAFAGHGFSPHVADLVRLLYDFHVETTPTRFAGGYLWAWR